MGTVSISSIICIIICGFACTAIPIALFLYFKKLGGHYLPCIIGACVFFVFVLLVESTINAIIFNYTKIGDYISHKLVLYSILAGLMAGLFEESGRFISFKTILKKYKDNDVNALMYGTGHGGCEAILLVSMTMLNNLIVAILINTGNEGMLLGSLTGDILDQTRAQLQELIDTSWYIFLLSLVERVSAIVLHLSLSVLVWYSAKNKRRVFLFPLAILLHALVDMIATYLSHSDVNLFVIEIVNIIIIAVLALVVKILWNKESRKSMLINDMEIESERV